MTRLITLLAISTGIIAVVLILIGTFDKGDDDVKADFTILLDEPIAREGGTVILLPTPRAAKTTTDKPVTEALRVGGQVSVVRIYYTEGDSYTYRFRSFDDKRFPNNRITSERLLVGSSTGIHPDTSETVDIPNVLTHHIEVSGGNWSKSRTRTARTQTSLGFEDKRYPCVATENALVCDATPAEASQ